MVLKNKILFMFAFISVLICNGQSDTINQVDANGFKQGYWEKKYPNGKILYKGYFKDNKPVGIMTRFYESGAQKAEINFYDDNKSKIKFYYEDGSNAANGYFIDNKKDSTWNYYSYYDKTLKATENYKDGQKQGKSFVYYSTGQAFDELNWVNGEKHGEWTQYFQNGNIKMITYYENNILHGCFNVFFDDNQPEIVGRYENNVRHGDWIYFNKEGEKLLEVKYNHGQVLNKDVLNAKQKEFFDEMEKNLGKIQEPKLEDVGGF